MIGGGAIPATETLARGARELVGRVVFVEEGQEVGRKGGLVGLG